MKVTIERLTQKEDKRVICEHKTRCFCRAIFVVTKDKDYILLCREHAKRFVRVVLDTV